MKISNIFRGIRTLKEIKEHPVGFFIDLLLATIISALLPIPFIGTVVARYKNLILWMIGGILLCGLVVLFAIVTTLFSPFLFLVPVQNNRLQVTGIQGSAVMQALAGYLEPRFTDTDIPSRNPLGGNEFTNAIITFDYHQAGYGFFNGVHEGIDLYPSQTYFQTNKAYLKTGQIIIFATLNGTGDYYVDQYGSNTVEIVNKENTLKTIDMHLSVSFISTGQQVRAGQPVGVMGETGEATGVHLHYQIDLNAGGTWTPTDPKQYIN